MKQFYVLVISLIASCGSNDTWTDPDVGVPTTTTYMSPTDKGTSNPCPPPVDVKIPDGGTVRVAVPCRSGSISTQKGVSDPPGWGNEDMPSGVDPGPLPPRTPPGDPVPF